MKTADLISLLLEPDFSHLTASEEVKAACKRVLNNPRLFEIAKNLIKDRFPREPEFFFSYHEEAPGDFYENLSHLLLNDSSKTDWCLIRNFSMWSRVEENQFVISLLSKTDCIKQLDLSFYPHSRMGIAINSNQSITSLTSDWEIISRLNVERLGKLTKLKVLGINGHIFPHRVLLKIVRATLEFMTLRKLILSNCVITSENAELLEMLLRFSSSLQYLDLSRNHLHDTGLQKIAQGLRDNTELKVLNIKNNHVLYHAVINELIVLAAAHPQLRNLLFNLNPPLYLIAFEPLYVALEPVIASTPGLKFDSAPLCAHIETHNHFIENLLTLFVKLLNTNGVALVAALEVFAEKLNEAIESGTYPHNTAFHFDLQSDKLEENLKPILQLPAPFTQNMTALYADGNNFTVKFNRNLLPSLKEYIAQRDNRGRGECFVESQSITAHAVKQSRKK